jgi:hypothetical protein
MRDPDLSIWKLAFDLPERIALQGPVGRWHPSPCQHTCRVDVELQGNRKRAVIIGASREAVTRQAEIFLDYFPRSRRALPEIVHGLIQAPRHVDGRGGSDGISFAVGSKVTSGYGELRTYPRPDDLLAFARSHDHGGDGGAQVIPLRVRETA